MQLKSRKKNPVSTLQIIKTASEFCLFRYWSQQIRQVCHLPSVHQSKCDSTKYSFQTHTYPNPGIVFGVPKDHTKYFILAGHRIDLVCLFLDIFFSTCHFTLFLALFFLLVEMSLAICQISKQVIFPIILQHVKQQYLQDKKHPLGPMFSKEKREKTYLCFTHLSS